MAVLYLDYMRLIREKELRPEEILKAILKEILKAMPEEIR
jgi:hypothetical protein